MCISDWSSDVCSSDLITPVGPEQVIKGLTGFFEAPWIMKRKGVYYMLYAGNNAGPDSVCTPAVYHACQAYGTAPSPLGQWTWRGVVLKPVSSTTRDRQSVVQGQSVTVRVYLGVRRTIKNKNT